MSNSALMEVEPKLQQPEIPVSHNGDHPSPTPALIRIPMFVDCLIEPAGWQRSQRRLAAVISLSLQLLTFCISLLTPLIFTDVLPAQQLVTFLVAPPPPPPPPPPAVVAAAPVRQITAEIVSGRLVAPTRIPDKIRMIKEDEAPPATAEFGVPGGVAGGVPGGQLGGVIGGIISSAASRPAALPSPPAPKRLRISEGVSAGQLIRKVQPDYPKIAKDARIQGVVELSAWISKDGGIERLTVVKGHAMLIKAALDAVKQWQYRPFLLNGEPIAVETTVEVIFTLDQGS